MVAGEAREPRYLWLKRIMAAQITYVSRDDNAGDLIKADARNSSIGDHVKVLLEPRVMQTKNVVAKVYTRL